MTIAVRLFALALLAGAGYLAYLQVRSAQEVLAQNRLLANLDAMFIGFTLTGGVLLLAIMVALGRKSAAGEGKQPRFRFGPWAKGAAVVAAIGGLRTGLSQALDIYRMWHEKLFDKVLVAPDGPRQLAVTALVLALSITAVVLSVWVLIAPRSGK